MTTKAHVKAIIMMKKSRMGWDVAKAVMTSICCGLVVRYEVSIPWTRPYAVWPNNTSVIYAGGMFYNGLRVSVVI